MPDPFTLAAAGAGLVGVGLSAFNASSAAKPPAIPKPPRCEPADTWYEQALSRGAAIIGLPSPNSPQFRALWDQMSCDEKNFFVLNPTANWQVILACRAAGQKAPCLPTWLQKLFGQVSDGLSNMGASVATFGQGSAAEVGNAVGQAGNAVAVNAGNTVTQATSVGGRGCFGLC